MFSAVSTDQTGRVLVVDDEEHIRELLRDLLEAQGHQVIEAEDGRQALQKVTESLPDVLLLDVKMPELDGFEVCRRLKGDPKSATIAILLVTALRDRRDRLKGIEAGANDFLTKPIDAQDVILRVRNAVYAKRLFDRVQEDYKQIQELQIRIQDIFRRYVSDQVVDMALRPETRLTLGGEEHDVVVMFSDLRGFTQMQEKQGPEETVAMLNAYHEEMVQVISQHNGTLSRMAGDGLMVLFGVPVAFGDELERAIRTSLEMRGALHRLNDQRSEAGKDPLQMGIGICAGRMLAGNIGSHRRMEYTVVGDAVNLASRLVDIAASDQILVNREVNQQIKDRFRVEYFRTIRVKGKQRPVDIYELEGVRGAGVMSGSAKEGVRRSSGEIDLTIPMLPDMELVASKTAAAVAEFMKLEEDKVEEIQLALIEACLNAIEHSKSKEGKVYINLAIHDDELEIAIQDFGEGFDVEEIQKGIVARAPGKLLKRGRGMRIMEGLMDTMEVQSGSKGTLIRMIKRR
jgi:class 3 adenylate cyclase/CheY-like chemotaxis protein/anti-sigma regulatory factor (Ser/Thr protein kinase)